MSICLPVARLSPALRDKNPLRELVTAVKVPRFRGIREKPGGTIRDQRLRYPRTISNCRRK
jgi:hypothetical protein